MMSHFGVDVHQIAEFWNLIDQQQEELSNVLIPWMLAALYFLHEYPTMEVLSTLMGRHVDTVRKWTWKFINLLATIDVVSESIVRFICKLQRCSPSHVFQV